MALKFYLFSLPLTSISSLLLGLFVLYKNPKNSVNQTWFLSSLGVGIWSALFCLSIFSDSYEKALVYAKILTVAVSYVPVLVAHFCIAITNQSKKTPLLLKIGYLNCFILTIAGFSDKLVTLQSNSLFPYYSSPKIFYHFFTIHFFFYFFYEEYILFSSLGHLTAEKRNQVKYVIIAITCGYLGGATTFLPVYGIAINPVSSHFIWLYAAIISYAIVKHQLMDITIIIRKGLIYSFLIGLMTFLYFSFVFLTGTIFKNIFGFKSWPSILFIFTIIAVCFKPIERKIQHIIDRFILKRTPEFLEEENKKLLDVVQKQDQMKAVATLAAGMAHEIKNPLTSIKTFAEYLPQKYDDPGFREKFSRIVVDEVDRVNNIVKQLLEFSKPKDLELRPESITAILDDTLNLLSSNLLKNKIEVVKSYKDNPIVSVDKNQLKQAFLNLFLNSIQAMPNGGVLTVTAGNASPVILTKPEMSSPKSFVGDPHDSRQKRCGNDTIIITISDTGYGIPKDQLEHVFDPFFSTKEDGTGLGLSIVHGIITKHGGEIKVGSDPGKGAAFRIVLKNLPAQR